MIAVAIATSLLTCPASAFQSGRSQSARDVLTSIDRYGATAVLRRDPGALVGWVDRISSGDAEWLEVARRLKPGTDAGKALQLEHAVAEALPRAPARVLPLLGRGFKIEFICHSPYSEDDPVSKHLEYLADAERALEATQTKTYKKQKELCLRELRAERQSLVGESTKK